MKRVLVYIDEDAVEDSIDLLEVGRLMYGTQGFCSYALAAGVRYGEAGNLFDHVFRVKNGTLPNYDTAALARCIEFLHRTYCFDAIIIPATHCGRMIAPRAAMRLHAGLVADVTGIGTDGDEVLMVRPAFSGRMLATVVCRGGGPVMMSARPKAFTYGEPVLKSAEFIDIDAQDMKTPGIRLIERREKSEDRDIRTSEVLISGGGGVIRDFHLLERLAEALHGMVAASRKVVDMGKAQRSIQVGQSGKIVSPRLYIALGISGSAQHVAGIRNAEYIISVNTNRQAPICSMSDIVVEGDSRAFVEGLLKRMEASNTQISGDQKR
jgi:electron transfer flavoprotein alpha subunit